jgi:small-conductance mechanosensitive channel
VIHAGELRPVTHCVRAGGLLLVALAGTPLTMAARAAPPTPAGAAQAVPQPPRPTPTAAPIPVPEIAQRAEDVAIVLRQSADALAADVEMQRVVDRLPAASEWIRRRLTTTRETLAASPSSTALINANDSWRLMRSQLTGWDEILARRVTRLERELAGLNALRATWSASREEALATGAPALLLDRTSTTLAAIQGAAGGVERERTRVLGLQDRLVDEIGRCDDALGEIARTRAELAGPFLGRDSRRLWESQGPGPTARPSGWQLRAALRDSVELTTWYLGGELVRVPFQGALFLLVLWLARLARDRARSHTDKEPSESAAAQVFERPVAAALVLALLTTVWIYPHPPRVLINAVGLVVLLPTLLIVRRVASPPVVPAVHALAAFFLVDRVRELCAPAPVLEQRVFLLEMLFGLVFLALAMRSEHLVAAASGLGPRGGQRVILGLLWVQLALLSIGILAGVLGYMRLARLLGTEVLASSYIALVLYAGVRVGEGLVAFLLRVRPVSSLFMVEQHRDLLLRRVHLALRWVAVGTWAYFTLDRLGMASPLWAAVDAVLGARYARGSLSISVGDVVAFTVTLWAAFLISTFLRFVLQEDVYPRLGIAAGLPYAFSSLLHYAIVTAGFLFAVAALGVDLTRITVLAGALGVGVGIGLQSVVANFAAGVVLLLERRIRVGDSIETADLQGEVREIGFRASTVRTGDGAEVVVPNGKLAFERVTNWTLSDRRRRVNLSVVVSQASDPARVLDALHAAARAYPKALADPAPLALCTGFRDGGLVFELHVWTARFEESGRVCSDVAIAVHAALAAAGIEIASPTTP